MKPKKNGTTSCQSLSFEGGNIWNVCWCWCGFNAVENFMPYWFLLFLNLWLCLRISSKKHTSASTKSIRNHKGWKWRNNHAKILRLFLRPCMHHLTRSYAFKHKWIFISEKTHIKIYCCLHFSQKDKKKRQTLLSKALGEISLVEFKTQTKPTKINMKPNCIIYESLSDFYHAWS